MGTTKSSEHKNDMKKKKSIFGRLIRQGCGRFGGGKKDNFEIFFTNMHPDMFKDS